MGFLAFLAGVWLALSAGAVAGQVRPSAQIFGSVLDKETGRPIPEVLVSLSPGGLSATTGTSGRFALREVPFGSYAIRFERLGYVSRADSLNVGPGLPVDITLHLATYPIPLDPISVSVRSAALNRAGFYDRREVGLNGTFFTEMDIQKLEPQVLTDLMYRAPSTIVVYGGLGQMRVRFNRQVGMNLAGPVGCEPAVFLDGALIQDQLREPRLLDFNRVPPSAVAAIEMYVGVNVPIEYKRNSCGTVLIWTKRGG